MRPRALPQEATAWAPGWQGEGLGAPPRHGGELVAGEGYVMSTGRYVAGLSDVSEYDKPLSRVNVRGDTPAPNEAIPGAAS